MRGRRGWAAVLLAGVAGVAATGPVLWLTALPAAAFTAPVNINDKAKPDPNGVALFNPNVTTVHVGDKVRWTNKTVNRHTVTSDPGSLSFDSGDIRSDAFFEWTFTQAGEYTYHCTRHPSMVGRIEVVDPSTSTTTAPAPPPPPTTTTVPAPPTTMAPPAPPPPPTTATTSPPRPPAGAVTPPAPPVSTSAPAPLASSSTTTLPSTTTTTVPPTTATSAPPALAGGDEGGPPSSGPAVPPGTASPTAGDKVPLAAGPPARSGGHDLDVTAMALFTALVAVGAFGIWTLIRVRPGTV